MVSVSKIDEFSSTWSVAALSKAGDPAALAGGSEVVDILRLCQLVLRVLVEVLLPQLDQEALVVVSAEVSEVALIVEAEVSEAASEAVIEVVEEVSAIKGGVVSVVDEVGTEVALTVMVHPLPMLLLGLGATEEATVALPLTEV